jgi:hypothetical protein
VPTENDFSRWELILIPQWSKKYNFILVNIQKGHNGIGHVTVTELSLNRCDIAGYEFNIPQGAFYLFPKSPIADDLKFLSILKDELILAVPGVGFGAPGYFRLSYAVPDATIAGSFGGFKRARERV